jgi:ABC-type multidrug transport system fused ATPase/permease subunit
MSPAFKYSYGRLGLFVLCFLLLWPTPLNVLVKAMLALLASAVLGFFVLRKWRDQMGEQLSSASAKRAAEKQRLRAALAGDEEAAAAGDRVAFATARNAKSEEDEEDEAEAAADSTSRAKNAATAAKASASSATAAVDAVKAGPPESPRPTATGSEDRK